jgi:hypothetical protein
MADMSTYLDTKVADYITTELTITPHNMLVEEGQKRQYFHEYDSGDMEVVTTSGSFFTVKIQWDWLSYTDAATILDFFHDSAKANARENTFYWLNPIDSNTYVVRFGTDLSLVDDVSKPSAKVIPQITLLVEGVKA